MVLYSYNPITQEAPDDKRISWLYKPCLKKNFFKENIFIFGRFELRASHACEAGITPPVHFGLVSLEMGSHELFAWAGLKPQSF
jgi:hypothetical protein